MIAGEPSLRPYFNPAALIIDLALPSFLPRTSGTVILGWYTDEIYLKPGMETVLPEVVTEIFPEFPSPTIAVT